MDAFRSTLAALTVEQKTRLLAGADNWSTHGSGALGLRPMVSSDGPSGVRGLRLDERSPSSCLPCPAALGATWDPALVREVAAALGAEARGKGVDVLLAPTLNLLRTPLSGRGFECFAEDPVLTARIAVSFVVGVQDSGVAATVKHYVCNDSETQRRSYDARIAEEVLRELYLAPFEACVREAGVWLVMAAYSGVNGTTMTEHDRLLRDVLKGEWAFTGVVVSDWGAVRSTDASATAGVDLAMPGPDGVWGEKLAAAVQHGLVPEEMIDDKVIRLLRLAHRVGAARAPGTPPSASGAPALAGGQDGLPADSAAGHAIGPVGQPTAGPALADPGEPALADPGGPTLVDPGGPALIDRGLLRRVAAASFVLLRNDRGVLPIDAEVARTVAVIGPNAIWPVIHGGGSAAVSPVTVSVPAGALRDALRGGATVTAAAGCATWERVPVPAWDSVTDPVTGQPGIRVEFRAADGALLLGETRRCASFTWWDDLPAGIGWGEHGRIVLRARFRPDAAGRYLIGASGVGQLTVTVDGAVAADGITPVPADPVEAMTRPGEIRAAVLLTEAQQPEIAVEFRPAQGGEGPVSVRLGITAEPDEDAMLDEATALAAAADVAVLVVGSAELTESEGFDRTTLALPGRQDELISRVARVSRWTIVVVNAGTPVLMPWADEVGAVLYAWLPGQEMGSALADVLLGRAEPGGRLPVSMPAAEADCPVLHARPCEGRLDYSEGLLIGYRGYDRSGIEPLFPFGHGLGYTTWAYESLRLIAGGPAADRDLELAVQIRNTGPRPGREVIQVYLSGPDGNGGPEAGPDGGVATETELGNDTGTRTGPGGDGETRIGAGGDGGRPWRVLAAFGAGSADPGQAAEVVIRVPARAFARYDAGAGGWIWPGGVFTLHVGRSSRDLRLTLPVTMPEHA